jgi:predicted lipid-binding transport protein (Tim44 family)
MTEDATEAAASLPAAPPRAAPPAAWWAGAILQGLVLGGLTAVALFNLIEASSGAQIFRYQGF